MKRAIDIEQLLTWTFVDELPKRELSSAEANWDNISKYGSSGGVSIGGGSSPQRYAAISAPHPDAVIVGHQVESIAEMLGGAAGRVTVDYFGSRPMLFSDGKLMMAPREMSLPAFNILVIVKSMAVMKRRPRWNVGLMYPQRTLGANGKPVVKGIRPNGRYEPDAHCPLTWTPSIRDVAEARAEYLLWHRALTELADSLADSLVSHAPTRPGAPGEPWIDASETHGQLWPKPLVTPGVIAAIKEGRRKLRRGAV